MSRPVVVLGDVLLDVDVETSSQRLVPDAPVPVLDEQERRERPGGAALAALLAARDPKARVVLVASIGDDAAGDRLRELLAGRVQLVELPCTGSTPVKTRLRCGGHTVARLDSGTGERLVLDVPATVQRVLGDAAAVLVSDYGGGLTRYGTLRSLVERAGRGAPVVWDPHPRGAEPVAEATLVTPNAAEAARATGRPVAGAVRALRQQAETLLASWGARNVAVTLGERGALLASGTGDSAFFPAPHHARGDACGAGDCFAAAATTALAAGALPSEAVSAAVSSASHFVAAGGVGMLDREPEPPRESLPSAQFVAASVRAAGGLVVATGGCFDLLHAGHIETLNAARALGDCLIVCVNSDESVRRLKGPSRPLQPVADRVRVLSALRAVDAVTVFDETTPHEVLARLRPDVWVKGGDYAGQELPEAALLRTWGGEVVTVPYLAGRSTTELVDVARR